MERIDVEGLSIAYERVGSGSPIVLLHGYVGDGPATWQPQLEAFGDDFTVIAWDAPAAGGSSDSPETLGMAGYADCLAAFVAALGLDRPHVVGLSFGGALALELCRRHPQVPSTLVLASAYAGWAGSLCPDVAEQRLAQALRLADLSADEFVETLLPTMFSGEVPDGILAAYAAAMRAFHPSGFRATARASAEDLRAVLPHVNRPALLVYGDRDVRAPLAVADALHAAIQGSALAVLPGVGHVCNIEAPDEFNQVVRDVLFGGLTRRRRSISDSSSPTSISTVNSTSSGTRRV
jgi:pimeloyl-ACP methyl ester carboxylesterase